MLGAGIPLAAKPRREFLRIPLPSSTVQKYRARRSAALLLFEPGEERIHGAERFSLAARIGSATCQVHRSETINWILRPRPRSDMRQHDLHAAKIQDRQPAEPSHAGSNINAL